MLDIKHTLTAISSLSIKSLYANKISVFGNHYSKATVITNMSSLKVLQQQTFHWDCPIDKRTKQNYYL